jgi:signal transduction histidine kinase
MVSHIVAAHSGRIELDSEEGVGSTFTIQLPLHRNQLRSDSSAIDLQSEMNLKSEI